MKTNHWIRWVVIVLLAVAGCRPTAGESAKSASTPIRVSSAIIETRPMPNVLPLTGTLVANQQSDVAANASGRVVRTYVERGSFVRQGDPLVQLDMRAAALSEAEAAANLASREAEQRLAAVQCQRNSDLIQRGAISRDEWEQIETRCRTSSSAAEAARARASLAEMSRTDAIVRAPFSGLIGERFVSIGEYVQPASKIASVVQVTPLRVKLSAPEQVIGDIAAGGEVSFEVVAFPGETFVGTVQYVAPAVNPTTRDVVFEALIPNEDGRLKPGMFTTATLRLPDKPMPAVPVSAVKTENGTSRLFLIIGNRIEERIVQTGATRDGHIALLDGARLGERFVLAPNDQVKDNVVIEQTTTGS